MGTHRHESMHHMLLINNACYHDLATWGGSSGTKSFFLPNHTDADCCVCNVCRRVELIPFKLGIKKGIGA
jgi:hypothetical protein